MDFNMIKQFQVIRNKFIYMLMPFFVKKYPVVDK